MHTATVLRLPYMNGTPEPITCASCGSNLDGVRERVVSSSRSGPKFFCKQDPEDARSHPEQSCFLQWKARHQ